eukprot:COSAG05_NODE_679_length_7979_cov_22.454442_7_plen_102_part_00
MQEAEKCQSREAKPAAALVRAARRKREREIATSYRGLLLLLLLCPPWYRRAIHTPARHGEVQSSVLLWSGTGQASNGMLWLHCALAACFAKAAFIHASEFR